MIRQFALGRDTPPCRFQAKDSPLQPAALLDRRPMNARVKGRPTAWLCTFETARIVRYHTAATPPILVVKRKKTRRIPTARARVTVAGLRVHRRNVKLRQVEYSGASANSSILQKPFIVSAHGIPLLLLLLAVKQTLAWKLEKSKTPVWNYLLAWEYPVNGGITSFHCSEIAFAFRNVNEPHIARATGGGTVALALQEKVAGAWVSFAKTGNPGAGFKPWTPAEPNTMVFDSVSKCKPLRDDELIALMGNTGGRGRGAA